MADNYKSEVILSSDESDNILGVLKDWRGVSEQYDQESSSFTPPKPGAKKHHLNTALRSTGGVNFGTVITSVKAREKAKRLVCSMALSAPQDLQTSRLILVNLENRRISSHDRENLAIGINYLVSNKLEDALKCFSKAIMVCKQVHIAMIYRGIVHYRLGKFFLALDDFTGASKNIEASHISIRNYMEDILIARFNRGVTYLRLGDDTSGLQDLKFALAVNPANLHVRSMLMQAQRRASSYIEAVENCVVIKALTNEIESTKQKNEDNNTDDTKNASMNNVPRSTPSPKRSNNNTSKFLKRLLSSQESLADFNSSLSASLDVSKIKLVDVVIKEPETCFPGLSEKKNDFLSKKTELTSAQNTMFLENFKHANGFQRHMFDTHFIRLNTLQEALIQPPETRTEENKHFIKNYLRNFPIFCDIEENLLLKVSSVVEYRAIRNQSIVFFQGDPVGAVVLVLSGALHLRLDHGRKAASFSTLISELGQYDMYDPSSSIFHAENVGFLGKLNQICIDAESGKFHDFSPNSLINESFNPNASQQSLDSLSDLPRSLQPGTFMTCKVASPSELILLKHCDFVCLLRHQAEIDFFKRLELLKASGIFSQGAMSYYDMVRVGRMCVLRRYKQGDVILSQGDVPNFLYFVQNGSCKAMKRPDPTEYLCQRLKELRDKVNDYDEKYAYHHTLRGDVNNSTADSVKGGGRMTAIEHDRNDLRMEIARLEVIEGKEVLAEKKRREEEKELAMLGHKIPDQSIEVSNLHWPQIFGEAAVLQPDDGVSAGTIIADTTCHLLCLHKAHLQTFVINKKIQENVRNRSLVYPSHEKLVYELDDKEKWISFKDETLRQISKDKWPGFREAKPRNFYI